MPLNLDTYPHPQLRYTIRLKYICPIYGEEITDYLFMSEEEYSDSATYQRILSDKMGELNSLVYDGEESKVEDWECVEEVRNSFYESEILSDAVISLLKDGFLPLAQDSATDEEVSLALLYLYAIREQYGVNRIRKEISQLKFNPKAAIVDKILDVWHTSNRNKSKRNGRIQVKWTSDNLELVKLLSERDEQGILELRKALDKLNQKWAIRKETNAYRRAVILAKFLCDYPATKRLYVGFEKGMRILCDYFGIPKSKYKRHILIPSDDALTMLSKPQRAFQEQIREPWEEFIRQF